MPDDPLATHSGSPDTRVTRVDFTVAAAKRRLRSHARDRRLRTPPQVRHRRDLDRTRHLLTMVERGAVVALYLSRPDEPSTLEVAAMLWRRGHRILAPVLTTHGEVMRREPRWAWYHGPSNLRVGYRGIPEPVGPALPAATLAEADVVLVSGLAGGRDGSRLGAGAGWFDRALAHARPEASVLLLLDDEDVTDSVPNSGHDHQVDGIVTQSGSIATGARSALAR